MKWADQLIKLSNFELDILQRRVARAIERRVAAELKLAVLIAEGEAEIALARSDPEAAWKIAAFSEALKQRKAATQREIDRVLDKISAKGMGSLTVEERRFLSNQSRFRKKD